MLAFVQNQICMFIHKWLLSAWCASHYLFTFLLAGRDSPTHARLRIAWYLKRPLTCRCHDAPSTSSCMTYFQRLLTRPIFCYTHSLVISVFLSFSPGFCHSAFIIFCHAFLSVDYVRTRRLYFPWPYGLFSLVVCTPSRHLRGTTISPGSSSGLPLFSQPRLRQDSYPRSLRRPPLRKLYRASPGHALANALCLRSLFICGIHFAEQP